MHHQSTSPRCFAGPFTRTTVSAQSHHLLSARADLRAAALVPDLGTQDRIICAGDLGTELYFVAVGEVEVATWTGIVF